MCELDPQGSGRELYGLPADFVAVGRADGIGPREAHDVCSRQPLHGFSQQASRQKAAVAERLERIEQHDIEIAGQPPVLKGVVQQQHLVGVLPQCLFGSCDAIGVLQMRYVRKLRSQFQRLVIRPPATSISPADERDIAPIFTKPFRQPANERRLPCPADGQVANADHRGIDSNCLFMPVVKSPVPAPDRPAVHGLECRQQRTGARSHQTPAAAGDDVAVSGGE